MLELLRIVADGARQAQVELTFLVRKRVVCTHLAYGVPVRGTSPQHAAAHRARRARLALPRHLRHEVAIVTHAGGIVGVGARRLHA